MALINFITRHVSALTYNSTSNYMLTHSTANVKNTIHNLHYTTLLHV